VVRAAQAPHRPTHANVGGHVASPDEQPSREPAKPSIAGFRPATTPNRCATLCQTVPTRATLCPSPLHTRIGYRLPLPKRPALPDCGTAITEMTPLRIWPLLFVCAAPTAQTPGNAAGLVANLQVADQRDSAHRDLLKLGDAAVPALIEGLASDDSDLQRRILMVIAELGPAARATVPTLQDELIAGTLPWAEGLDTLAELVLFRDPEVTLDAKQVLAAGRKHFRTHRGERDLAWGIAAQRLRARLNFPIDLDTATLISVAGSNFAWRVEAAVDLLGAIGPAAHPSLPQLQALLTRPEPRILLTEHTVPLHRKVCRALNRVAPTSAEAALARRILAGDGPTAALSQPLPKRAAQRIETLLHELERPATRESARANLVALGRLTAIPVATAMLEHNDADFRNAALGVITDLGRHGATAVPQLYRALISLPTSNTVAVYGALSRTEPWCRDKQPPMTIRSMVGKMTIMGHRLEGEVDIPFLNAVNEASTFLRSAMSIDPASPLAELTTALKARSVLTREAALRAMRERGITARGTLPTIEEMMTVDHPSLRFSIWVTGSKSSIRVVDRSEAVRRLAAEAILSIAAPDNPVVTAARELLAR
jgi:hypothetical protein